MRKTFRLALILSLLCVQLALAAEPARQPLVVFAAASLTDVLQKVSDEYQKSSGTPVKLSFAASSALAKQIESGAKADVFVSADQEWMSYLTERRLIDKRTRADLLGNKLVLIAPSDSKTTAKVGDASLLKALGDKGKLATGDPDSVPVGKYAKQALTSLRQWDAVQARIARADNVRVALMYVARGEAPLGIVYSTDAVVEPKVRVIDTFPASSHPPITYPMAVTSVAQPGAQAFVDYLRGPAAKAAFEKAGFTVLSAAAAGGSMAMGESCSDFRFDVSRELKLLGARTAPLAAAADGSAGVKVAEGRAYTIALQPQANVKFVAKPEKVTMADGSYAGIVGFTPAKDGNLRVGLSEAAWIDVLVDGKLLTSASHSGSHNCKILRKAVQFEVRKSQPVVLQFSGTTAPQLNLVVTQ